MFLLFVIVKNLLIASPIVNGIFISLVFKLNVGVSFMLNQVPNPPPPPPLLAFCVGDAGLRKIRSQVAVRLD